METTRKKLTVLLCFGILGCILMGSGDWIMIYGDPGFEGQLSWLTLGVGQVPAWRNTLAMALSFPAVICYSLGLFALRYLIPDPKLRRNYCGITTVSMTPWLCLHLFYVMIFYLHGYLTAQGDAALSLTLGEALAAHFGWLIPVSDVLMLLPFFYLLVLTAGKKTAFRPWMALNNPLLFFVLLKLLIKLLPDTAFRLAFLNGLMSESMLVWFLVYILALGGIFPKTDKK